MLPYLFASLVMLQRSSGVAPPGGRQTLSSLQILDRMRKVVRSAGPVTVTQEMSTPGFPNCVESLKAMQPGLTVDVVGWIGNGKLNPKWEYHWTGAHKYVFSVVDGQVQDGEDPESKLEYEWIGLENAFSNRDLYKKIKSPRLVFFDNRKVYAIDCTVGGRQATLFVNRTSFLPAGYKMKLTDARSGSGLVDVVSTSVYTNFVAHANLRASDFAWIPPKGARVVSGPSPAGVRIDEDPTGHRESGSRKFAARPANNCSVGW